MSPRPVDVGMDKRGEMTDQRQVGPGGFRRAIQSKSDALSLIVITPASHRPPAVDSACPLKRSGLVPVPCCPVGTCRGDRAEADQGDGASDPEVEAGVEGGRGAGEVPGVLREWFAPGGGFRLARWVLSLVGPRGRSGSRGSHVWRQESPSVFPAPNRSNGG
jgi:hypothetical protein